MVLQNSTLCSISEVLNFMRMRGSIRETLPKRILTMRVIMK